MNVRTVWFAGVIAAMAAGCGGGGSKSDSGRATVGAAGGTLATDSRSATCVFPAGALGSNIDFTVDSAASAPSNERLLAGTAFDFGPSTVFSSNAQLTIKYNPSRLPAGALESRLVLYKAVGGAWVAVPGSVVNTTNRSVSAPISSFSTYGILADNQFAGHYAGTFAVTHGVGDPGNWNAHIGVDGNLTATADGGFTGTGKVGFSGTSTIGLNGSGTTDGYRVTYSGSFTRHNDGSITGQGTWSSSSGSSGTWTGSKTGG